MSPTHAAQLLHKLCVLPITACMHTQLLVLLGEDPHENVNLPCYGFFIHQINKLMTSSLFHPYANLILSPYSKLYTERTLMSPRRPREGE